MEVDFHTFDDSEPNKAPSDFKTDDIPLGNYKEFEGGGPGEMVDALNDVVQERIEQTEEWGLQDHSPFIWSDILGEEVGEVSKAILHTYFGGNEAGKEQIRDELIQVAAVAIGFAECLDRNDYDWSLSERKAKYEQ